MLAASVCTASTDRVLGLTQDEAVNLLLLSLPVPDNMYRIDPCMILGSGNHGSKSRIHH